MFIFFSEKHGTCSYPVIQDEYDYFATTLNLYTKYNVTVSVILFLLLPGLHSS
jgi:ribonuclease I